MSEPESFEAVEIPYTALSAEALCGVIDSFVLREGTDYGEHEYPLERKREQVLAQIRRGEARILYDPESDTVTIDMIARSSRRRRGE